MRHLVVLIGIFFLSSTLNAYAQSASDAQPSGNCYAIQDREAQQKCLRAAIKQKAENPGYTAPAAQTEKAEKSKSPVAGKSCCKICSKGQPCGNSCISRRYTCHKGPGCAC